MLAELRRNDVLTMRGQEVEIHDFAQLVAIGDFDEAYLHRSKERPDTGE